MFRIALRSRIISVEEGYVQRKIILKSKVRGDRSGWYDHDWCPKYIYVAYRTEKQSEDLGSMVALLNKIDK